MEKRDTMHNNPSQRKRSPLSGWAFIVALVGAGAMPCPECGLPLAWHLWPLAVLLALARLVQTRVRRTPQQPAPSVVAPVSAVQNEQTAGGHDSNPEAICPAAVGRNLCVRE